MVVNHGQKWVFVSVPKTGTHSMYKFLTEEAGGERVGHFHDTDEAQFPDDYMRFTSCRNPYDRALSIWESCRLAKMNPEADKGLVELVEGTGHLVDTFFGFMHGLLNAPKESRLSPYGGPYSYLVMNLMDYHAQFRHDHVVRLEYARQDLACLPRDLPEWTDPRLNHSRPDKAKALDLATQAMVEAWAPRDFMSYGYVRRHEPLTR